MNEVNVIYEVSGDFAYLSHHKLEYLSVEGKENADNSYHSITWRPKEYHKLSSDNMFYMRLSHRFYHQYTMIIIVILIIMLITVIFPGITAY